MKRIVALIVFATGLVVVPPAMSSHNTCFGLTPNAFGTSEGDKISAGYGEVTVNGVNTWVGSPIVIDAGRGNDDIYVDEDSDTWVYICAGRGSDTIRGGAIAKLHGEGGYDRADVRICGDTLFRKVEKITASPQTVCK